MKRFRDSSCVLGSRIHSGTFLRKPASVYGRMYVTTAECHDVPSSCRSPTKQQSWIHMLVGELWRHATCMFFCFFFSKILLHSGCLGFHRARLLFSSKYSTTCTIMYFLFVTAVFVFFLRGRVPQLCFVKSNAHSFEPACEQASRHSS